MFLCYSIGMADGSGEKYQISLKNKGNISTLALVWQKL
jgi:hypothetical protein